MSESQIINLIKQIMLPVLAPGAHDLLDDTASLPPCPKDHTRVISLDASQENSDFKINLGPLESAGWRAIIQNLSDLAASGAKPVGFLWSLEIPKRWLDNNAIYLREYLGGALKACLKYKLFFYGGDISLGEKKFSNTITIFGDVLGKPLRRQDAKVGEKIYVSRTLGSSGAGLRILLNHKIPPAPFYERGVNLHLWPTPELELGQKLINHASACMDISDGLAKDLHRLCKASKLGAKIYHIPIAQGATLKDALSGGEDYALLFTAKKSNLGIEIGDLCQVQEILLQRPQGFEKLDSMGYDHFKS